MQNTTVTITAAAIAAGHTLRNVEAALLQRFVTENNLTPSPGGVLAAALNAGDKDVLAAGEAIDDLPVLSLDDLVMAFETLVPAEEAKKYGAVFTPSSITSFMAQEAVNRLGALRISAATAHVVDPAVGCGALLVAAMQQIVKKTGEQAHTVAERLFGSDISDDSVRRARLLLTLTALHLGDTTEPDLTRNIVVADALASDWQAVFGRSTFELVLGNPPYVRYQHLDDNHREVMAATWESCGKGNFNLYFPFFEVARTLADPSGSVIAYITPNNFTTSLSGGLLRKWMIEQTYLDDVVDFGHHRVFEALTYTAITFAHRGTKAARTGFGYAAVAGLPGLAKLPKSWARTETARIEWAALSASPWRLVGKANAVAVKTIAATAPRLDSVADIRFGVATCRDKLYLLDGTVDNDGNYVKTHNKVVYRIEPGVTRPCARVSSLADQASLAADKTAIIYPYSVQDGRATVLGEEKLMTDFPGAYAYLVAIRPDLDARDKGKKTYAAWYAYARTQGLVPSGDKLLTPLYAAAPRMLRDGRTDSLFINGCSIAVRPGSPEWVTLDLLRLVLTSGVCRFFVENTSVAIDGGFYAYQKSQLGQIGLPEIEISEVTRIAALPVGEQDDELAKAFGIDLPEAYRRT